MNKKVLLSVILILALAGAAYVVAAHRASQPGNKETLPANFASIHTGMSESDVLSQVGQPWYKSQYAKYENKPPAYWAALQQQASAVGADQASDTGAPSMAAIRAASQLTHQYHDVWQYKPVPSMLLTLYFSDKGTLLNIGTASGGTRAPESGSRSPGPPVSK